MQPQGMTIALRQRMPWEATDLGIALVRAHAGRIFAAWCVVTLPVWAVFNAVAWRLDMPWLALLAMWWLKPLFDRIPLYAISRAVFGRVPSLREIVHAQFAWGWRAIAPWLLWRRFHSGRLMLLPVDLLEGLQGSRRRERVRALTRGDAGPRNQLVALGTEFELVLSVAVLMTLMIFVPTAFLSDAARSLLNHLFNEPPVWALIGLNACVWFGSSLVEPFVVGAGFGLYLNRRVQLEAWDIEHAFRRIAARLSRGAQVAGLVLVLVAGGLGGHRAQAQPVVPPAAANPCKAATGQPRVPGGDEPAACKDTDESVQTTLPAVFGSSYRDGGAAFARHVDKVRAGLSRTERDWTWQWRERDRKQQPNEASPPSGVWQLIADFIALVAHYGLWILAALLLGFVLYHHKTWMSWLRDVPPEIDAPAIGTRALEAPPPLPDDIPAAVRALWRRGEQRAALALLYQAAVQRLSERLDAPLPPGATEGECLARSRRLGDRRYAGLFARIVACWQAAAYARRMPEGEIVEGLLNDWTTPVPAAVNA